MSMKLFFRKVHVELNMALNYTKCPILIFLLKITLQTLGNLNEIKIKDG